MEGLDVYQRDPLAAKAVGEPAHPGRALPQHGHSNARMRLILIALVRPALLLTPPPRKLPRPRLIRAVPDEAPGTVLGSAALVAGTTVGAGILALPAKTLAAGLAPTATLLVGGWVFMAATGLLIAEVDLNTACVLDRDAVSTSAKNQV